MTLENLLDELETLCSLEHLTEEDNKLLNSILDELERMV